MASATAVWGIDIGQCALKAMRCTPGDGNALVVDEFDYIEYPKILTEPDADPEALVRDALKQFLSNHSVRDAKVAISVPGQSGLSRFIKLPPVEAKKIPDIVKFEAKQQIPFSLEDVIWDYQALLGGMQDEGVALETEVGLFAMKRDQVFRALRPFRDAGIELDVVQLTPIAIYNAVTNGVLKGLPDASEYDPDNPPESVAVISMGTDTTDLVVTNGFKIWQRSIPIGGSHFTKQLMKEMKLTFAAAEQLKRNARESKDAKAVFQAMRPAFRDLVDELNRSIGFFKSINRGTEISRAVALGNAMLLPGLQPYIEKNLEIPVRKVGEFRGLDGNAVSTPMFKDNLLSFGVAYGLCVQGAGKSRLSTNLIPRELITARLIRRKKPWALMALTIFLLGISFNYLFNWSRWNEAHADHFQEVKAQVDRVKQASTADVEKDAALQQEYERLKKLGNEVVGGADARFLALELYKAVNSALPRPGWEDPMAVSKQPYENRPEIFIESVDSQYFPDLSEYFGSDAQDNYEIVFLKGLAEHRRILARATANAAGDGTAEGATDGAASEGEEAVDDADSGDEATDEGETGDDANLSPELPDFAVPGWVIQIKGFHFHNNDFLNIEKQYLIGSLMNQIENGTVQLPAGPGQPPVEFTMKELGIYCPIVVKDRREVTFEVPDLKPSEAPQQPRAGMGGNRMQQQSNFPVVRKTGYEFTVQFMWLETTASERLEARKAKQATDTTDDVVGG